MSHPYREPGEIRKRFAVCATCDGKPDPDQRPGYWECGMCGREYEVEDPKDKRIAELEAENRTLRDVVEQSVMLYGKLYEDAIQDKDIQAENFWEGHQATAMYALGQLQEANAAVDLVLAQLGASDSPSDAEKK